MAGFDFQAQRDQIIQTAYLLVGACGENQSLTASQIESGSYFLNAIIKNLRGPNILIWDRAQFFIPLSPSDIIKGSDNKAYECIRNHTLTEDTLPITGGKWQSYWKLSDAEVIPEPIIGRYYKSVRNVDLDDDVMGVLNLQIMQKGNTGTQNTLYPMVALSEGDFASLAIQTIVSDLPNQYYFIRQINAPNQLMIYPYPSSSEFIIQGYYYKYPAGMDSGSDTLKFPAEWIRALTFALASDLAAIYPVSSEQLSHLRKTYAEALNNAQQADHEFGDFAIVPNRN